jgi:hypothetical protein
MSVAYSTTVYCLGCDRNTSHEVVEQDVEAIAEVDLLAGSGGSFGSPRRASSLQTEVRCVASGPCSSAGTDMSNLLAYVPRSGVSAE